MTWFASFKGTLQQDDVSPRFLLHDNEKRFADAQNTVFQSEHIHVIPTSFQAPNANDLAERWVRAVREECLDKLLIFNETHMRRVLTTFANLHPGTHAPVLSEQISPQD